MDARMVLRRGEFIAPAQHPKKKLACMAETLMTACRRMADGMNGDKTERIRVPPELVFRFQDHNGAVRIRKSDLKQ